MFILIGNEIWLGAWGQRAQSESAALGQRFRKAGSSIRVPPMLLGSIIAGLALGWLLFESAGMAATLGVLSAWLPWGTAKILESRKRQKFAGQLAAALDLIAGALRSGQSLNQALQSTAD